jgi:hypothetical protein
VEKLAPITFEFDLTQVNRNNRRYTKECLVKAVAEYKDREFKYGNIGNTGNEAVDIGNASHEVTEIYIDDDGVIHGEIKLLTFGMGPIAAKMYLQDMPLTILPRGLGQVREEDGVIVIYDYKLIAIDIFLKENSAL